jgi:hypothetical protein
VLHSIKINFQEKFLVEIIFKPIDGVILITDLRKAQRAEMLVENKIMI